MANKLLVGGFEGFGRHRSNPSADIALPVAQGLGADIVRLPVDFDEAFPALKDAYEQGEHEAVLLFGLGAHASNMVKIETGARNFDMSMLFADANGKRRLGFIEPNADWRRPVTIDTETIRNNIETAGVRARFSRDAGTYVCNHLLYRVLGDIEAPAGFLHLGRGMSDEQVTRSARAAVQALQSKE
jgi:pyroglutamyl-peptidase